jgi:hypothetical protein
MTPIDKIAWIRLEDGKILSTAITWERRHRTWQRHARGLTYADRDRVSPVDQKMAP